MKKRLLHSGEWVVVSDTGLYTEGSTIAWPNKKSAVDAISTHLLDPSPSPMIRRMAAGEYIYFPKNYRTGRYEKTTYSIIKLTKNSAQKYTQQLQAQSEAQQERPV